jgi:hypothetical protein
MNISKEVIKKTTNCKRNFICLSGTPEQINCKVIDCINNKVHFVECKNNIACSYKMAYGNSLLCNCPVRKELFTNFKLFL